MAAQAKAAAPRTSSGGIFAGYKGGAEMPLAGYAALLGLYNTAFAAMLLAAKKSGHSLPHRISYADLLLLGVGTFKLSRLISRDRVTSPLRAPFTEYEGPTGTSEVKEHVRGTGMRRAVGDLLTCPFCMGPWVAAALIGGLVFKPRATRLFGGVLAAATISDFLHHAYGKVKKRISFQLSRSNKSDIGLRIRAAGAVYYQYGEAVISC